MCCSPRSTLTLRGIFAFYSLITDELFFDESTEQSRIKATIVRDYFWAWARVILPTVKQQNWPIAYIDLFAGPGRYKDGTKSTPLLILESAIADAEMQRRPEVGIGNSGWKSATKTKSPEVVLNAFVSASSSR
jgi:hypothetical protein